jgi:hypothetical protein
MRPYFEKPYPKKLGWWSMAQSEGLEFKPKYRKKKKKKN